MALYAVNTGCRDSEISNRRWEWEVDVPQLRTSVFIIPGSAAELARLLEAANTVCETGISQPELLVMRGSLQGGSRKTPASSKPALQAINYVIERNGAQGRN